MTWEYWGLHGSTRGEMGVLGGGMGSTWGDTGVLGGDMGVLGGDMEILGDCFGRRSSITHCVIFL